jgi:calmodulin
MSKVTEKVERVEIDMPEEERQQLKEAFDMFDKDGKGSISVDEIYRVMKNFGNDMSKDDIRAMIADLDEDGSGEVDFEEFIMFMKKTQEFSDSASAAEEDEVLKAFQVFDKDGNGHLSADEFKHILTNLGDRFTDAEVNEIFKEADLNHDGKLEYREFINFWRSK